MGMLKCEYEIGQSIVIEGDIGKSLFIIKSGTVKCFKGEVMVRELREKDYIGESAILFEKPRSLSIFASTKTTCYQISQSVLIDNIGVNYKKVILTSISKEALRKSKYMKIFEDDYYFQKIFDHCRLKTYQNQEIVICGNEGKNISKQINHKLFILLSGNFLTENDFSIVASRGEIFGDLIIKNHSHIKADIIAQGECQVLEFNWDEIADDLNINIEKNKILSLLCRINHMRKLELFHHTSENRLMEICKVMQKEKYKANEIIFKEGEIGNKLYLIKSGIVKAVKDNKFIREHGEGNCFGEVALLINEPRSATLIAETDVSIYSLTKETFNNFIDKHMFNYLAKKLSLQDSFNQPLESLFFCKSLGKGKFGTVSLVHNYKNFYAMKAVSRLAAEKQKILTKYFIQERTILLKLDHPFIMKLVRTYKTQNLIFFMLEYIPGKVMSKFLQNRSKSFINNTHLLTFYLSSILIVLSYLNSKGICHRDLKPDNIMIDEKGYLKLLDFGTSIELTDFTHTITGTPHYIAPEIMLGKGYGFSCDYWSTGIIAHELYFGYQPFGKGARDPIDVYREIIKKDLHFSKGDPQVIAVIKALLNKKVSERICSLAQAKQTELLIDFKWNELEDLRMKAPFVPKVSGVKEFNEYNVRYIHYIRNEIEGGRKEKSDSLLSSYQSDNNNNDKEYISNWADVF